MGDVVMAATAWPTNAELIGDLAHLGYLRRDAFTLDPTYGRGTFWNNWRPYTLVKRDKMLDGCDFRDLPYPDGWFDQIAYDPPYIAPGGRSTSTIGDFNDRYGLHGTPRRPEDLQGMMDDGLTEMFRLVRPGGIVVMKCCDYVNAGSLWLGTHWTLTHAIGLGFRVEDRLEHLGSLGPQPPGRQQVHARHSGHSVMFVFRKPRKAGRRVYLDRYLTRTPYPKGVVGCATVQVVA